MTPYYADDFVTIYHGDCRDFDLATLGADLLLADPPYGIGYAVNGHYGHKGRLQGQTVRGDDAPFDPRHLLGTGKRHVIFGFNHFAHLLPPGGLVIWSKVQDNRWSRVNHSLAEVAWTDAHRYTALYNCFWAGSPLHRTSEERGSQLHPTQKPVELMRWIVDRYTEPGALVLDPYMGSGPTARACLDLGRKFIGIEIEERYCEIAARRCSQEVLGLVG